MSKKILSLLLYSCLLIVGGNANAQLKDNSYLFRLYDDNDGINITGNGTDEAYTNGTRFDLFYMPRKLPRTIPDRWMPRAGQESVNTYGWGFMQAMFTPRIIKREVPPPGDYAYSAGLFIIRSLHSANPVRKYNLQTSWVAGVMGPWALGKETQTTVHRLLGFQTPRGWSSQLKNDVLLNLNIAAEKQLFGYKRFIEVIGGTELCAGTMLNTLSAYSLIRIGKMQPYFNGYLSQYATNTGDAQHWQLYFTVQPSARLMLTNALIEGGMFSNRESAHRTMADGHSTFAMHKLLGGIDYGVVAVYRQVGFSLSQKSVSSMIKGLPSVETGNISLYIAW
ncbi:lipid A deacylase LpxR family protein [Chitinophaga eiseniae]|uniref:Lipid A deacylase LpxR family protein n=1 Tax=Chitinophaga eiseniae TaxID=634771 RepID=A0A847SF06_9BACT|nr:lipid A deacylase LpxR family protein [Chitinophaga eiseniae]NLR77417.1 lipid A deacylase LpxR family protein [Chitinophaga eiseniae]